MSKLVFLTVGTTSFDALSSAADDWLFAKALVQAGYTKLVMQVGAGKYRPHRLFVDGGQKNKLELGLDVEWFEYASNLSEYLDCAALVISHAGAGSIFETLRKGVPLIAVPNPALMDNHQKELAEKLEEMGHLVAAEVGGLVTAVKKLENTSLKRYEPGSGARIVEKIGEMMGVPFAK